MAAGAVVKIGSALVSAAPSVAEKTMNFVRKATKGRVNSVADAVKFVQRGPAQASIVAQGLAAGGMPVNDIISVEAASSDPAMQQLRQSLSQMYSMVTASVDQTRNNALGHTDLDDTTRDVIRKDMALRLRRAFGSLENAQKIAHALETMTTADYKWAKAMGI